MPLKNYILPSQKGIARDIERELKEQTKINGNGLYVFQDKNNDDVIRVIPDKELLFSGKLKVLISYTTFSAASMCSALLEDRIDAITIGQETSGGALRLCAAADFDYRLPYTGIQISIPTIALITNLKNENLDKGHGTIPDILVDNRMELILEGFNLM